ncbi:type III secretion system cytoplasmic ring protein SctQ [Glaciimonas sp. PCH181]|uniref:type III secretion system cytoplasmic ring protein SctQ n=1 Tax=Glaciimonas sp. PCH181 TaxID=2133943 RepID=UPI0011B211DD|nr:type III secretion system cytoplasmic ring protein SctQ [Glaciimonas sp. PCH181]
MNRLTLRRLDSEVVRTRQAVMHWQAQNIPVVYTSPPCINRYIAFRASGANGDWNGLIGMDDWLRNAAPSLARLATGSTSWAQILNLFAATSQALTLPDALAYHVLQVRGMVDGAALPDIALPGITTGQGIVWLQTLPLMIAPDFDAVAPHLRALPLPMPLQFELGCSHISVSLLSRVAIGDALLIGRVASRIACNGMTIGRYVWTKEGIIVDQLQENYQDGSLLEDGVLFDEMPDGPNENLGDDMDTAVGNQSGYAPSPRSVARVPVRIEFSLGTKLVTLGELSALSIGQLLELSPDREKRIAILANGMLFGHGELIQLDDRLAVEINQLYGGNADA